ncbi:MAG: hypothetical protein HYU88_08680 [Chloroflexi bacterium]|nr:hypothetical protein [Chloroflexota bacterium]MBI4507449.1 hypothetical protein [Chloroflexota bacterium]
MRSPAEIVQKGAMLMAMYGSVRPEARLLPAERRALIRSLQATFGGGGRPPER